MTNVFLFGTLCWPDLLDSVAGLTCPKPTHAVLKEYSVKWAKGQGFPAIYKSPGVIASGLLLQGCDETVLARMDHYESGFGYKLDPVIVDTALGSKSAMVYLPPDWVEQGENWVLSDWVSLHGLLALEASHEVMSSVGNISPAEMAQRYPLILQRADARMNAKKKPSPASSSGLMRTDVQVHEHRHPYVNFFSIQEIDITIPRFDEKPSKAVTRAGFAGMDAAIVIPYDPIKDLLLLVEQFRVGPFLRGDMHPWMMEPIAGRVDVGEMPEQTAKREAFEEAGIHLSEVLKVHSGYASPGCTTEMFHIFVGIAELNLNSGILAGLNSEAEDIKGHVMTFDAFYDALESGRFPVSPLAVAGYWLALNRQELRKNF